MKWELFRRRRRGARPELLESRTLLAADVQYIFSTTATGMTALFDALATRPQLELVLALQEYGWSGPAAILGISF